MPSDPILPSDLYRGTAPFYDRYRRPYPAALLDDLCERLPVSGTGRLLDLACGTGQVSVPIAGRFADVVAVDQEAGSVAMGRTKARAAGHGNIEWITGAAETVELDPGFELVAVGNAFHRLDRPAVAARAFSWLRPRGGIALLWCDTPSQGDAAWQLALTELMVTWMERIGTIGRIPRVSSEANGREPDEAVLVSAGFEYLGRIEHRRDERWTVQTLTGFMYSTSILNAAALGARAQEFRRDLASLVDRYATGGIVSANAGYAYQLARKPG